MLCEDAVMLCCVSDSMSITDRQTEPLQEVLADLKIGLFHQIPNLSCTFCMYVLLYRVNFRLFDLPTQQKIKKGVNHHKPVACTECKEMVFELSILSILPGPGPGL